MQRIVVSICALVAGWFLQQLVQPTAEELEVQASAAWNAGDVQSAEDLARRTLFQAPASTRACDVLIQVARHDDRPELQAAVTAARSKAFGRDLDGLIAAGDIALSNSLLRLAEAYWEEALQKESSEVRPHQRLTALAGMRLDLQSMQDRLLAWSEIGVPDPDLILLYLGMASINERDASSTFDLLAAAVEADQLDFESRLGLGRCLFAMNKYTACAEVLSSVGERSVGVRAAALAVSDRCDEAESLLANTAEDEEALDGLRHFALGVIAGFNDDWNKAQAQFALAVSCQPLSRPFRSRYCETLRRNGSVDIYEQQVAKLEQLREVIELAAAEARPSDQTTFVRLKELCQAIDASQAMEILNIGG